MVSAYNHLSEDTFILTYLTPVERRRMMYHKPEVEAIWQKWLALPETDKAKTSFMDERRELVGEISRVSRPLLSAIGAIPHTWLACEPLH